MKRDTRNGNRRYGAAPGYRVSRQALINNGIKYLGVRRDRQVGVVGSTPQSHGTRVHTVKENGGVGVIYVGPSVDGADKEYVKVLSGEVDRRKPSFV
jgi:hypothetical protein